MSRRQTEQFYSRYDGWHKRRCIREEVWAHQMSLKKCLKISRMQTDISKNYFQERSAEESEECLEKGEKEGGNEQAGRRAGRKMGERVLV